MPFPSPDKIALHRALLTGTHHLPWFWRNLNRRFSSDAAHGETKQVIYFDPYSSWNPAKQKLIPEAAFIKTAARSDINVLIKAANIMLTDSGWEVTDIRHQVWEDTSIMVIVEMTYTR